MRRGAASGTRRGELKLAYAAPGNYTQWTTQVVAADPDLVHGNIAYWQYSLASTGTDQVSALYSKLTSESYSNLYARPYSGGMAATPEVPVWQTTDANRFARVNAIRNPGTAISPCVPDRQRCDHPRRPPRRLLLAGAR